MFRLIVFIILIILAIPFFNKAKDYISEKKTEHKQTVENLATKAEEYKAKAKIVGETTKKYFRYKKVEEGQPQN